MAAPRVRLWVGGWEAGPASCAWLARRHLPLLFAPRLPALHPPAAPRCPAARPQATPALRPTSPAGTPREWCCGAPRSWAGWCTACPAGPATTAARAAGWARACRRSRTRRPTAASPSCSWRCRALRCPRCCSSCCTCRWAYAHVPMHGAGAGALQVVPACRSLRTPPRRLAQGRRSPAPPPPAPLPPPAGAGLLYLGPLRLAAPAARLHQSAGARLPHAAAGVGDGGGVGLAGVCGAGSSLLRCA